MASSVVMSLEEQRAKLEALRTFDGYAGSELEPERKNRSSEEF
jgi:hypothetical protein